MRFRRLSFRFRFPAAAAAAVLAGSAIGQSGERVAVKRLFAPPEAVLDGSLRLPGPAAGAVASESAMLRLSGVGDVVEFEHGGGTVRVLPIAAAGFRGRLSIAPVGRGDPVSLPVGTFEEGFPRIDVRHVPLDQLGIGAETSLSEVALRAGRHRLSFVGDEGTPVFVAIGDEGNAALVAYRADAIVRAGEPLVIGVEARRPATAPPLEAVTLAGRALAGAELSFRIDSARVRFADGSTAAGRPRAGQDGSSLVEFPGGVAGDALVEISATVRDGAASRTRGVAILTRVAREGTRLAGRPSLAVGADAGWLELTIPVESDEGSLVAATELWAVGDRRERPIGWLGGIAEVERDEDLGDRVRLGLFASRLGLEVDERLEARAIRFHERDGFATLDWHAGEEVTVDPEARRIARLGGPPAEVDWMGHPGAATVGAGPSAPLVPGPGSHVQGLLHGYCASGNPWPVAQFGPDAWVFQDLGQNRPNDAFALELLARSQSFKSLGVIAHSQGGMAALHLYTFYYSGLDWAGPGRLIQAVGGPFEGTPIAGVLAALGAVFGVQCGSNYDMTPEGAAIWLSTIPPAPRAKVHTFTTSYTGPGWSGYCSLATSLFLAFPEDGVTEHASGHFPGANDLGLTYGWCHVGGMRDPDQALDAGRNAAMRQAGAR